MVYDLEFPNCATRILKLTAILGLLAAAVASYWGWTFAVGALAGTLFQYGFLSFLRAKYTKWQAQGRAGDEIGTKLVGYTVFRLLLEIATCIVAALCVGLGVLGFLAGLLSLTAATVLDKVVSVIKE